MEIQYLNGKIEDLFNSLDEKSRAIVDEMIILLSEHSYNLRMPFSKSLGAGLFELRIVGMTHVRIIYTYKFGQIWFLHAFIKKTNKIPKKEIEYARRQIKRLK